MWMNAAENISWDLAHKLKLFSLAVGRKTDKLLGYLFVFDVQQTENVSYNVLQEHAL
jgi:hypothetical protein